MTSLTARRIAAPALKRLEPHSGRCLRCDTPWPFIEHHTTQYEWTPAKREGREPIRIGTSRGMFPLCEPCWQELGTPEARLPYYEALVEVWVAQGADRRHMTHDFLLRVLDDEADQFAPVHDPASSAQVAAQHAARSAP